MKTVRNALLALVSATALAAAAAETGSEGKIVPQDHYGFVARRLVNALERRHVLQQPCDDVIS